MSAASLIAGTTGGMMSFGLTYPLSVVVTRQATQKDKSAAPPSLMSVYNEGGLNALFSGCSTGLFAISVSQAIFYFLYDWLLKQAKRRQGVKVLSVASSMGVGFCAGAINTFLTGPMWRLTMKL